MNLKMLRCNSIHNSKSTIIISYNYYASILLN